MTNGSRLAKPRPDDKEQSKAFIDKAREIEADEENSAADLLMGRLARTPPDPKLKPKTDAKPAKRK
jgi:hypothetical protein